MEVPNTFAIISVSPEEGQQWLPGYFQDKKNWNSMKPLTPLETKDSVMLN